MTLVFNFLLVFGLLFEGFQVLQSGLLFEGLLVLKRNPRKTQNKEKIFM